jgi:hypothetical protein
MEPQESGEVTYEGLDFAQNDRTPHLGGSIRVGDPYTYCPAAWNYVISRFCIRSILDVGSGSGNASYYFHKAGMQVVAVEGLLASVETSLYPAVLHDLTKGPLKTRVDLVHCQEVVEHIEEQFIDNVLDTLLCGKIILITHALPGQGGFHHVNLQPSSYWIQHFQNRSCAYLEADTLRVRDLAAKEGARYMAQSGLLFVNNSRQ